MTLISYHSSGGDKGRRCDARCYNAKSAACDCICRGMNHGKGLNVAVEQTSRLAASWIERYGAEHPGEKVEFEGEGIQQSLFAGA